MLYEMLSGSVPFSADTPVALALKHVTDPPPPLRLSAPDIPEAIERVVMSALAKNPADRPATALDLAHMFWSAASEAMNRLLARTRETVHLSVLDGEEVVYVHKLDSPEPVRAYSEIGGRAPAFCVATGKAMLAWQPTAVLASVASHLRAHTPRTITDPQEYLREMDRIRANGYAVNRGEWRETVWGVAAAIRSAKGSVLAAIGVSGPSARIKPGNIKVIADEVIAAARLVERSLDGTVARAAAEAA
jgi:DNA-binding IclR family transcriptional regulator